VDVSARLLDAVAARLRAAGLGESIAGISRESATRLDSLATRAFDAVSMLGPLYHLCALEARRQAVSEMARILKPGGLLFAAGINRLAYLRDFFHLFPHDPEHAPPIGFAHLSTYAEFRALFAPEFEDLVLAGVESCSTPCQAKLNDLPPMEAEAWLDLIERTGQTAEGLGFSDHFLYVGRKAAS